MNLTTYFLKHPVMALVLNVMIMVVGALCFQSLSTREYPEIHFPKILVMTHYPNASADLVESTVTNQLEDRLAGVEGIETITSDSKDGVSQIIVSFQENVSLEKSLMNVREAVGLAELPHDVKPPLIQRQAEAESLPFIIVSLESSVMDFAALTHYAELNLKNAFRSIRGVSEAQVWGQKYTLQITLDPRKMYAFGVNASDVFDAVQRAHLSLPVGKFQNEIAVTLNTDLKTVADFENLVILDKNPSAGRPASTLLKQISKVSLKTDDSQLRVRINGRPGLCIGITKANDANPLEVSTLVRAQLEDVRRSLPDGVVMTVISDQADFVRASLKNVKAAVLEAILCVMLVVFVFLRNLRATLIPLVTIPISLLGSLFFLKVFGYSLNTMTLLAMVLAIGLVVDDAIVVLENIQRHLDEGLSKTEATLKGAREIAFAIIACTCTLTIVYAPLMFVQGVIGQLFGEFAVALAGSVLISGVVALTLSPWMCTHALRPHQVHLWPKIDESLLSLTTAYQALLQRWLTYPKTAFAGMVLTFVMIMGLAQSLPHETAPKEDRGLVGVYTPPIPGKGLDTLEEKVRLVEAQIKETPEAQNRLTFMASWGGNVVLPLKPHTERTRSASEIADSFRPLVAEIPSIDVHPWSMDSALPGEESNAQGGGLSLVVSTTESYAHLFKAIDGARKAIEEQKLFPDISHNLKLDTARYRIDVNPNEMAHLNLTPQQVAKTIEIFFSGNQSLTFTKDGLLYPIMLKGDRAPWDLNALYVVNQFGKRISLGTVAEIIATSGPTALHHENQMRAAVINATLPMGAKIGDAMNTLFKGARDALPDTYKLTWDGAAKAHAASTTTMLSLFALAILFIFAVLAVQFENFVAPLMILSTVPLACVGALALVWSTGGSLNIYTQIGMVTLIGLITKHGILIVEFANTLRHQGASAHDAVCRSAALRLRPILMTTGAMLFGALPLLFSSDAGHEARHALGIVLIGGLGFGTLFTLFILPAVYCSLGRRLSP